MNNYRYALEKYNGRSSRYKCPQCGEQHCFVRYIDTQTGEHLSADTGRCNREVKCGYHKTPADYLSQNSKGKSQNFYPTGKRCHVERRETSAGNMQGASSQHSSGLSRRSSLSPHNDNHPSDNTLHTTPLLGGKHCHVERRETSAGNMQGATSQHSSGLSRRSSLSPHNDNHLSNYSLLTTALHATLTDYGTNHLVQFLTQRLGVNAVQRLLEQYRIGTHHHWRGSTVFWYVDAQQQVCSGKVMLYNPADGRRVKQPFNHITWMHSLLKMEGFSRRACLFGEHLLRNTVLPVSIVESEKTALIAAHHLPQSIWLATGGLSALNVAHCKQVLKGRKVTLFPDEGAYDKWYQLSVHLPNCNISRLADNYGFRPGNDLGDLLLRA